MSLQNIFVGRQPIYNPNLGVYAYELLFRSDKADNRSQIENSSDQATFKVMLNSFFEMGLDNIVGNQLACINLGENYNLWKNIPRTEPDRIILDIPQNLPLNVDVLAEVRALKEQGYLLASGSTGRNESQKQLFDYVDIIRLDVRNQGLDSVRANSRKLHRYKVKLLADKVENLDDFDELNTMGFDFFQGYFLSQPRIVMAKSLPNNRLSVVNLISTLTNQAAEVDEIEQVIDRDANLSYKLLKLINSAGFGLRSHVDSIRHAIIMLGKQQLASWATMLALGSLQDRPPEMIQLCMIRAKTCELLAQAARIKNTSSFFTVGLLSALDLIMERKLSAIIKPLPLSDEVKLALLEHKGVLGEALSSALAFEFSQWDKVSFQGLASTELVTVNLKAYRWANEVTRSIR